MSRLQEKHPLNPFTNRGVITNPDEFFGREQEIIEIVSRLRAYDQPKPIFTIPGRTNARTRSGKFWRIWRSARGLSGIGVGRRFRDCYAKRLSKRVKAVIV
jgi:hypothetical protein